MNNTRNRKIKKRKAKIMQRYDFKHARLLQTEIKEGHVYEMYQAYNMNNFDPDDYIIIWVYDGEVITIETRR